MPFSGPPPAAARPLATAAFTIAVPMPSALHTRLMCAPRRPAPPKVASRSGRAWRITKAATRRGPDGRGDGAGDGDGSGGGSVPLDAPSSVLLAASSLLAITTVGCVFELSGGHPQYGPEATGVVLAVSAPAFMFLFYAAVRKGQQEALDDP